MIAAAGLPATNFDDDLVDMAFNAYRDKDDRAEILAVLGNYHLFDAKITMIGVWDTVGSLGIPAMFGGVDPVLYGFLDTSLHPDMLNAYQALAIDERRAEFPATLWTSPPLPGQTIEQVWFAGAHCDVGGSDAESGLSDVTLSWMMNKARTLGSSVMTRRGPGMAPSTQSTHWIGFTSRGACVGCFRNVGRSAREHRSPTAWAFAASTTPAIGPGI
jgi:uncharacterized protein (DUF2235 family)